MAEQALSRAWETPSVQRVRGYVQTLLNPRLLLAERTTLTAGKDRAARLDVLTYDKYYVFSQVFAAIRHRS